MYRSLAICTLLGALAGVATPAAAQDALARGIDPVGGRLATTSDSFLTVEGSQTAKARSYGLGLFLDYNHGLMSLRLGDDKLDDLLVHRLDFHLMGSYAVTDWLELGADLPITAWQDNGFARLQDETGFAMDEPGAAGLGDLRLIAKARVLQQSVHGVGLAALGEVRLPTGDHESFLGERGVTFAPGVVIDRSFGAVRLAAGGGYRYRSEAGRFLNLHVGDELGFSFAGAYAIPSDVFGEGWTAIAEILASTPSRAPFNGPDSDAMKTGLEGLLGLKGNLGSGFSGLVGVGTGLSGESGLGREGVRAFAGVRYQRDFQDRDGDGIEDHEDQCPDVREDHDGFEDADGCPDPDNDKDGVPDVDDRCPDTPGLKEYEGCPDSDRDEIPDHEDACPEEYGVAKKDGCPADDPLAVYDGDKIDLRGAVNFDTAKATIKRESWSVLDTVARVLRENPQLKRVRIDGHTDSQGSAQLNRSLSKKRAQAVVQYLIEKGIARERFDSEGFGEDQPIADNKTALGRAKNRRVEFTVLESD